jgi:hypothetical protein
MKVTTTFVETNLVKKLPISSLEIGINSYGKVCLSCWTPEDKYPHTIFGHGNGSGGEEYLVVELFRLNDKQETTHMERIEIHDLPPGRHDSPCMLELKYECAIVWLDYADYYPSEEEEEDKP